MDFMTALLNFINVFQLETGTAPTMADVAARFTETRDVGYYLGLLVRMESLISFNLAYAISAKGLEKLQRATGVVKLVSGSMIIGFDPADGDDSRRAFMREVISHRNGNDQRGGGFMASTIGNDPRLMGVSPSYHEAVYFGQWFIADTAEAFRKE